MTMIRVVPETMNTFISHLQTAAGDITARLDELEARLEPMRATWEGEANLAYVEAKATWDATMAELVTLLQTTSQNVATSAEVIAAQDRRNAAGFLSEPRPPRPAAVASPRLP